MKHILWFKVLVLIIVILFSFQVSAFTQDNVVGEWHLNETGGTNAPDTSGSLNNGTLNNMEDGDWVSGQLNNALLFGGTDEFVDLNGVGNFERTDIFSLEFWFKTSTVGTETILSKQSNTGNLRGWTVFFESGQIKTSLISNDGASDRLFIETDLNFNDDVFHHFVATYDGSSDINGLIIYIDGSAAATTVITNNLTSSITNSVSTQISGRNGTNLVFNGTVDEVVIYDTNITAADVAASFNGGVGTEFHPPVDSVTIDIVHPDGGETFDNSLISTIDINFNVQSPDTNLLLVDLNFSTSASEGTGTVIINDVNTDSALITCADTNFVAPVLCTFSWDIDLVVDNNYFILASTTDQFVTASDFNSSDANFLIFSSIVPNVPITEIVHPNGGEIFDSTTVTNIDINFTVQDDDNNSLLVDLNFSTTSTQGTGTVIINDTNTDSATITCDDSDFSDVTNCTFDWDITAVPDGVFFILNKVIDSDNNSDFDSSDDSFVIGVPIVADIVHPNGGEIFDKTNTSTVDINFTIQNGVSNSFLVDLNFSTSASEGTGTVIIDDINTTGESITCTDTNFVTPVLCTFSWDITAVPDGDFFIIMSVTNITETFEAGDAIFEIFASQEITGTGECVIDLEIKLYLGQYLQINYSGFDDTGTLLDNATFNLFREQELLLEDEPLVFVNRDFLLFQSDKKINDDPYIVVVKSGNCINSETIQAEFS